MSEFKAWLIVFGSLALLILTLAIFSAWAANASCKAKWQDSGRQYDWSIFGDCRVSDKTGKMIPEKNIRDIN